MRPLVRQPSPVTPLGRPTSPMSTSQESPTQSTPTKPILHSRNDGLEFEDPTTGSADELIGAMNSMHSKMLMCGTHMDDVTLPQIAVVGAQSVGKSSVLETLAGQEFLPRGQGVVTRRPILIQLIPSRGEEYAKFLHKPTKFTDFKLVRKEIEEQMPVSATNSKSEFSSVPIQLEIFSPKVLKLTLVDLPGLVRVPVDGNSPDSVNEVREMVLKHITPSDCIILAVSPANQDLATSDALEIAKIVDPERERTIGVITKVDRMEACTDARQILENRVIQLKRGYVGVINRSQQDTEEGRDFDYILESEKKYFNEHSAYRDIAHQLGTPYLRSMLQKTLRLHIKGLLPNVRSRVSTKLYQVEQQLEELKAQLGGNGKSGEYFMLRLVSDFVEIVDVEVMGNSQMARMDRISYGALINYKLHTEIMTYLKFPFIPKEEDLMILNTNLDAIRCSLTFSSLSLESINRKMIAEYEFPLQKSVDCVRKVLEDAVEQCSSVMDRYPSLKNDVLFRIRELIKEAALNTYSRLKDHIHAEMSYVNLEHPDLDLSVCQTIAPSVSPVNVWGSDSLCLTVNSYNDHLMNILRQNEPTQEKVRFLMLVMTKYLEIVQKQIIDTAIKYIVKFLITRVLHYMKKELVPSLCGSLNEASFKKDCEKDFRLRGELERTAVYLKEGLEAIQNF